MPQLTSKLGDMAHAVGMAQVAAEPISPLAWATAKDDEGEPLYMVAVVMGRANCQRMDKLFTKLRPHMKRVDIFDGTPGEPDQKQP